MKRLKKIGLKGFKFRFEFQIGQALNLPSDVTLAFLTITRGPKVGQSKRVVPSGAKAEWSETIVILSTLYKESKSPRFESKEARVSLKMPSGKTGYKKVGTTTVDLADYCNNEGQQQEVNVLLDGKSKSKASVMIRMVVKATFVANAEDDDSASEVSDMTHITMGSEGSSGKDDESLHGGNIELPSPTIGQPSPAASGRVRHNSIASSTLTETKPFAKKDVSKETEPPSKQPEPEPTYLAPPRLEQRRSSFSVASLNTGRGLLSDIAAGLNTEKKEVVVPDVKKAYEAEIKALKDQIAALKKENQSVYQKISKGSGETAIPSVEDVFRENMQLKDQIESLRKMTADVTEKLSVAEERLRSQPSPVTSPSVPQTLDSTNDSVQTPERHLTKASSPDTSSAGKRLVYGHARKSSRGLPGGRTNNDLAIDPEILEKDEETNAEVEKMKRQLADSKKSLDGSRLRCRELEREVGEVKSERDELLKTLIQAKLQLAQSEQDNDFLRKNVSDLKKAARQSQLNSVRMAQHMTQLEVQYSEAAISRK